MTGLPTSATDYLSQIYYAYTLNREFKNLCMFVSKGLWDQLSSEFKSCTRFTDDPGPMPEVRKLNFKAARVIASRQRTGHEVRLLESEELYYL